MTRIENKSENRKRRFREHFAKIAVKTSKGKTNKRINHQAELLEREDEEMITTKDKIYQLRHKWGMSQAEFAEKVEVSQVIVSLWELGKRDPSKEMLYKIAKAFDTSVEWLLKAEEPKQEEKVFTKDENIQQCKPTVDGRTPLERCSSSWEDTCRLTM